MDTDGHQNGHQKSLKRLKQIVPNRLEYPMKPAKITTQMRRKRPIPAIGSNLRTGCFGRRASHLEEDERYSAPYCLSRKKAALPLGALL